MKFTIQLKYLAAILSLMLLVSCTGNKMHIIKTDGSDSEANDLLVVDCLLPGRIQQLGVGTTYVTPRRPAKISAKECKEQGGEYTAYHEANTASALKVWLHAARSGDKIAQTYVGEIFEKGRGIEPDYKEAAKWYKKAADQGHPRAKLNLGYLFEKGLGVKKNVKVALQLYREASGLADADIQYTAALEGDATDLADLTLRNLKTELETERGKLAQVRRQLATKESMLKSQLSNIASKEQEIIRQQIALDREQNKARKDRSKIRKLQTLLARRQQEINKRRQETASLRKQINDYKSELASAVDQSSLKVAIAGPSIEMLNPTVPAIRGIKKIPVSPNIKTREIIGQVTAPAGLARFEINNQAVRYSKKGIFKYLAVLKNDNTNLRLLAVDKQGKRNSVEFEFVQTDKPVVQAPRPAVAPKTAGKFGSFYAIVIGNNNYRHYPKLSTAVADAKKVSQILSQNYGFRTTTLINANRYMIIASLDRMRKILGPNDNLLLYYAGHGEIDRQQNGYWLPVDAARGQKSRWISNKAITDMLNGMKVKRVLVVADSCYSGALTSASIAHIDTSGINRLRMLRALTKSRARTALTSGGLKPVLDRGEGGHSVFAKAFIDVLSNNQDIMEGQRLHRQIQARMALSAKAADQIPEYAPIRHAGHESGEFFLLPKHSHAALDLIPSGLFAAMEADEIR